ncbi:MAG: T9SS type A sorting domain-containing protein [Bacteroidia bacterium]|nr:T9SS type A sorting domain-containing protein [Bacteroidia bacterium]
MMQNTPGFKIKILGSLILLVLISANSQAQTAHWFNTDAPRFRDVNSVYIRSASELVAIGGRFRNDSISSIFISKDSGGYYDFRTDFVGNMLNDVWFKDIKTGFAVGRNGHFVKTVDSGKNWNNLDIAGYDGIHFNAVTFSGTDTGWIAGGVDAGNRAIILKTTNSGSSWQKILDSATSTINDIYKFNSKELWACGNAGLLYHSTNGGISWNRIYISGNSGTRDFNSINLTDKNTVYLAGGSLKDTLQTILKSVNSGTDWTTQRDIKNYILNSVYFYSANDGYAVGDSGTILFTQSSGSSWSVVTLPSTINDTRNLNDVYFSDKDNGVIGGSQGRLLHYNKSAHITALSNPEIITVISFYPNPASSSVTFNWPVESGDISIQIYSLEGSLMLKQILYTDKNVVNLNSLKAGVYLILVKNNTIYQ